MLFLYNTVEGLFVSSFNHFILKIKTIPKVSKPKMYKVENTLYSKNHNQQISH